MGPFRPLGGWTATLAGCLDMGVVEAVVMVAGVIMTVGVVVVVGSGAGMSSQLKGYQNR